MAMSPYQWKILELGEKIPQNKQTNKQICGHYRPKSYNEPLSDDYLLWLLITNAFLLYVGTFLLKIHQRFLNVEISVACYSFIIKENIINIHVCIIRKFVEFTIKIFFFQL